MVGGQELSVVVVFYKGSYTLDRTSSCLWRLGQQYVQVVRYHKSENLLLSGGIVYLRHRSVRYARFCWCLLLIEKQSKEW